MRKRDAAGPQLMRPGLVDSACCLRPFGPWLEQAPDPNILVEIGPVYPKPLTDQLVTRPLLGSTAGKQREPIHRD
jgi:hypothetical protein